MVKSSERLLAREMRRNGKSIREIAKVLDVSKSSVSLWCRDIILTPEQIKILIENDSDGAIRGRIKSWELHKTERQERVNKYGNIGSRKVGQISKRDLLLVGVALYWAEGSKTGRRIIFVNSDPGMIFLFIRWMRECFDIQMVDFSCRVQINESHAHRIGEIEEYWVSITGVPLSQFTKPNLIHAVSKKHYDSPNSYYGVLAIKVRRSTNMSYLVNGAIDHLREEARLML
ncbi:MAG: hypothetical protein ACD_40C00082G0002 [uncultured bacterium]|nr:MAG: hypothetical protein ACD_40C00082G0002 [uncultured bacterium]